MDRGGFLLKPLIYKIKGSICTRFFFFVYLKVINDKGIEKIMLGLS